MEPIERLRTVTALTGFTRGAIGDLNEEAPPKTVPLNYSDQSGNYRMQQQKPLARASLIRFDGEQPSLDSGPRWAKWLGHHRDMVEDALGPKRQPVPWSLFRSTAKKRWH